MAITKSTLGLSVREKDNRSTGDLPLTPARAKKWLAELPIANVTETANLYYQYLRQVNSLILDPADRLKLMLQVCPTTDYLVESIGESYSQRPVSLSERRRQAADQVQALLTETVIGFNTAIESAVTDPGVSDRVRKKTAPTAIACAIYYLSRIQLQRYQLYRPVGNRIWREIHSLFLLAERNEWLDQKVNTTILPDTSIRTQYHRSLLLALSRPYERRPGESVLLFAALTDYAGGLVLKDRMDTDYHYAVNPEIDLPPQPLSSVPETEPEAWRSLDLQPAIRQLESGLEQQRTGWLNRRKSRPSSLDPHLNRQLVDAWSEIKSRTFLRIHSDVPARICVGLNASCALLAEQFAHDQGWHNLLSVTDKDDKFAAELVEIDPQDNRSNFQWKHYPGENEPREDVFASIYQPRQAKDETPQQKPVVRTPKSYNWSDAVISNASPAGLCLRVLDNQPAYTEANEIITITYDNDVGETNVSVGIIRWARWINDKELLIGVELQAPQAVPVKTCVQPEHGSPKYRHSGLLLPALKSVGLNATIITAPINYQEGDQVLVKTPGAKLKVRLGKLLFRTENYFQFSYQEESKAAD